MYHTSHQTHSNHMLIQLPPRWNCMPDHLIKLINDHVKLMVLIIWSNSQGIDQLRSSCIDHPRRKSDQIVLINSDQIDHPRRKSLWLRTFFSCFRNFDTMSAGWSRTDKSLGINHFLFLIFDLWFVHLHKRQHDHQLDQDQKCSGYIIVKLFSFKKSLQLSSVIISTSVRAHLFESQVATIYIRVSNPEVSSPASSWYEHHCETSSSVWVPSCNYLIFKSRNIIISIWELTCLGPENLPGVFPRPPHPLTSGWSADRSPLNIRLWQSRLWILSFFDLMI